MTQQSILTEYVAGCRESLAHWKNVALENGTFSLHALYRIRDYEAEIARTESELAAMVRADEKNFACAG